MQLYILNQGYIIYLKNIENINDIGIIKNI